jgi:hypothetical protein
MVVRLRRGTVSKGRVGYAFNSDERRETVGGVAPSFFNALERRAPGLHVFRSLERLGTSRITNSAGRDIKIATRLSSTLDHGHVGELP